MSEKIYGSTLKKIEPYGTEEIPASERHGKPFNQFTLWFAANMVLAVLVSGFFSSLFGLTVWQGLSAVAFGSLLGSIVMGALAGIGTKLGVPQQVQGRGPMGYYGNYLPLLLLTVISALGWTAVNTVFAVLALQTLFEVPFWIVAGVIFLAQMTLAIWGHNLIHIINRIATAILTALFIVITSTSLSKVELTTTMNTEAPYYSGAFAGWFTFAGFFFAYVMTWAPFASDFSRYLPSETSHSKVMFFTASGNFIALMWLGSVGVLVSSFAGDLGAIDALKQLTGTWSTLAMWTVVISTVPVSAMNLYGGAISLKTMGVPFSRIWAVVLIALLSFSVTIQMQGDPYGSFYNFLLLLSYLVVPFITILLLDYYLRMRTMGHSAVDQLFDTSRRLRSGFVVWILACLASALFWNSTLIPGLLASDVSVFGDISYVVGALAAGLGYLSVHKYRRSS
jgi:purine-cytosine permease-like protein